jgi:hypothetical protein
MSSIRPSGGDGDNTGQISIDKVEELAGLRRATMRKEVELQKRLAASPNEIYNRLISLAWLLRITAVSLFSVYGSPNTFL